jgi:acetyl-CoA carboxylase biotin carboxyl carrier protein
VPLTPEDVQSLIAAFEASQWDEMTLAVEGTRLELTRTGRPPSRAAGPTPSAAAPEPAALAPSGAPPSVTAPSVAAPSVPAVPAAGAAPTPAPAGAAPVQVAPGGAAPAPGGLPITAPSVGLFWRSPQPGAPHFVDVGQTVGPDDTVCIVEVMKLMNHVKAGIAGVVRSVEAENGAMIEHGQVLFVLDPVS